MPSRVPEMELNSTLVLNSDQPRCGPENEGTSPSEVPVDGYNSSMEMGTPDQVDYHWTMVQHRRTHSHGLLQEKGTVTMEQALAIKLATERMTCEQKPQVQRCQEKIQPRREGSVSSRGEGPSRPKGKGIDPKEWGNLNLSDEELSIEAQAAALDSFRKTTQPEYTKERSS